MAIHVLSVTQFRPVERIQSLWETGERPSMHGHLIVTWQARTWYMTECKGCYNKPMMHVGYNYSRPYSDKTMEAGCVTACKTACKITIELKDFSKWKGTYDNFYFIFTCRVACILLKLEHVCTLKFPLLSRRPYRSNRECLIPRKTNLPIMQKSNEMQI